MSTPSERKEQLNQLLASHLGMDRSVVSELTFNTPDRSVKLLLSEFNKESTDTSTSLESKETSDIAKKIMLLGVPEKYRHMEGALSLDKNSKVTIHPIFERMSSLLGENTEGTVLLPYFVANKPPLQGLLTAKVEYVNPQNGETTYGFFAHKELKKIAGSNLGSE